MDIKTVRRRCEASLQEVQIPLPFDVEAFRKEISRRRGRPLLLLPKGTTAGLCGVWVALPEADYVFFEDNTSRVHREHIILHELGHLLSDHAATQPIDEQALAELLPGIETTVARRVLGRSRYSAIEEMEAEMFASLVLERVSQPRQVTRSAPPNGKAAVLSRLESALMDFPRG
jgi:hypothetical protein